MRQRGISFDECRNRYGVGSSTITLIMNRFRDCGKDLSTLKQMSPTEVEELFYPPENIRRKDSSVMPDYQEIYSRLSAPGSEYSCAMKSHFRKSGNQTSGKWKSSYASKLALAVSPHENIQKIGKQNI